MDKKAADKKAARLRRGLRARHKIRELGACRLCVHRTPTHIYAQLISPAPTGDQTLAAASHSVSRTNRCRLRALCRQSIWLALSPSR